MKTLKKFLESFLDKGNKRKSHDFASMIVSMVEANDIENIKTHVRKYGEAYLTKSLLEEYDYCYVSFRNLHGGERNVVSFGYITPVIKTAKTSKYYNVRIRIAENSSKVSCEAFSWDVGSERSLGDECFKISKQDGLKIMKGIDKNMKMDKWATGAKAEKIIRDVLDGKFD